MLHRCLVRCLRLSSPHPFPQPAFTRSAQQAAYLAARTLGSLPRGLFGPLETLYQLLHPVYEQLLLVL